MICRVTHIKIVKVYRLIVDDLRFNALLLQELLEGPDVKPAGKVQIFGIHVDSDKTNFHVMNPSFLLMVLLYRILSHKQIKIREKSL